VADMKYSKAMERLEDIIRRIENEEIDIDELSEKVKEAVGLVKLCKEKVEKAELEVKNVVEGFEREQESK
jgi:exodeoxyribonuclease VII small subunit